MGGNTALHGYLYDALEHEVQVLGDAALLLAGGGGGEALMVPVDGPQAAGEVGQRAMKPQQDVPQLNAAPAARLLCQLRRLQAICPEKKHTLCF
eukprot:scaffold134603_cov35-Prasinocladus_malaysianus.AAC.1